MLTLNWNVIFLGSTQISNLLIQIFFLYKILNKFLALFLSNKKLIKISLHNTKYIN